MKDYLTQLDANRAKTVLKYRLRMADYSDNYKKGGQIEICPLCSSHPDTQRWSFECPVINGVREISEKYDEIFGDVISEKLADTLVRIEETRKQ